MTNSLRKFLFDTEFDTAPAHDPRSEEVVEVEEEPELPPEPTFSEAELGQACADSFQAGKEDGLAQARNERDAEIAGQLQGIFAQFAVIEDAQRNRDEDAQSTALNIALAAVRKLFPVLERQHGLAEIEAIVTDCMQRLRDEPRLVVRAADAQLDILKERLESWAAKNAYDAKFVFLSEEGLGLSDVRVEWADGGAERDKDRIWREIDEVIARQLPDAIPEFGTTGPQERTEAVAHRLQVTAAPSIVDRVPHEAVMASGGDIAKVS